MFNHLKQLYCVKDLYLIIGIVFTRTFDGENNDSKQLLSRHAKGYFTFSIKDVVKHMLCYSMYFVCLFLKVKRISSLKL